MNVRIKDVDTLDTEIYKALSDESRLRIINILLQRELCVCEIESVLGMSQTNVSRHLNKLKQTGIVVSKKESQWAYYRMSEAFIENNLSLVAHLRSKFCLSEELLRDVDKIIALHELCHQPGGSK